MSGNAAKLYQKIEADPSYTKMLFRQALQDPQGALKANCEILGLLDTNVNCKT